MVKIVNNNIDNTADYNKLLSAIYEESYNNNNNRSIKQRLTSKLYPLSLFLNQSRCGGFKNMLLTVKGYNAMKKSDLFNVGYYLNKHESVRKDGMDVLLHYIYYGSKKGYNPSPLFNSEEYIKLNPDLKSLKINPLIHYLLYGKSENRKISLPHHENIPQFENKNITTKPKRNKTKNRKIKGLFNKPSKDKLSGWAAEIGNNHPINVIISIDNIKFTIKPSNYRADLKRNGINEGKHAFKFTIPMDFLDGIEHEILLKDTDGFILDKLTFKWQKPDFENKFSRYTSYSITNPIVAFPFNESDKKIFATMENIANYLIKQVPEEKPLVSIIMPVYNREGLITNSIKSVLNQTYKNFELIIIDDGSSDKTCENILKIKDKRIKLIRNKENLGISASRNKGLNISKGKYIMYLDSDNDWDNRYISAMVGAFRVNKDASALYCGQYVFEESKTNLKYVRFAPLNKGLLSNRNYIDLNAYAHTRDVYLKYGGFDESLVKCVDWDLILKYSTFAKTYSVPVILSNYYFDLADNTITSNPELSYTIKQVHEKQEKRLEKIGKRAPKLTRGVSVIIPSYEALDDLKICLESLFKLDSKYVEVVVVDNNSSYDVKNYLRKLKLENKIKLILNHENYGFTYAVNQAIEIAKKDNDIVLLNNDAVFTEGAMEYLQEAAYTLENCGITVPQQVLPANTKTIDVHVPYANPQYMCDVNLSAHHKNVINLPLYHNGIYTEVSFVAFFCVYIRRDVYDKSLGLDAENGRHYRSDVIYSNFIRNVLNYKIYHVSNAIVYHKLQKATTQLQEKSDKHHDLMFVKNRWSSSEREKFGYKQAIWDLTREEIESGKY